MNADKQFLRTVVIVIAYIYILTCILFGVYFNWQYATENGFIKWALLGEVVSTAKGIIWPYYILGHGPEKTISAKDIIIPSNAKENMLSESELEELSPVFEAIKSSSVTEETINLFRKVLNNHRVKTGSPLSQQSYQETFGLYGQAIEYKMELGKSAILSWDKGQYKETERFKALKKLVAFFISQEQLKEDIEMIKTAAVHKAIMTDSQGNRFAFGRQDIESGLEKYKARWQAFLKVDAAAQEFIERASKPDDSNRAEEYIKQGIAYGQLGKHKDALLAFKEAIRLQPDNALAHSLLGTAYSSLGRFEEAEPCYKKSIQSKPDFYAPYFNLGSIYNQLGRHKEAIEAYKQAINLKPDDSDTHYNLGITYLELGNREAAMEEYKILKSLENEKAHELLKLINK